MALLLGLFLLIQTGCDTIDANGPETGTLEAEASRQTDARRAAGVVYTMTNDAAGNAVIAYGRAADGRLVAGRSFPTNGLGSGDGLNGTSNPLILSDDAMYLYAVNAGSNDVAIFRRNGRNLDLRGTVPSGGERPVSVTTRGDLVYVLNVGGAEPGNIAGFRMVGGTLEHLVTRPLGAGQTDLPQIGFSPDGRFLVVTDKPTNTITTYVVDGSGVAGQPNTQTSSGQTPFGFAFTPDDVLIVSEAFGGGTDASAASSYRIHANGALEAISAVIPTTETAACWAETTANGKFAYVTNTGSSTVTGYAVAQDGSLSLLDASGETGHTGAGSRPVDLAIAGNAFMYVHSKGTDTLTGFAIDAQTGALTPISGATMSGLPASAVGVAAF
ncbi:MAG: beta-propeller fold lactonase family protein [Rhodothermales bacterium]